MLIFGADLSYGQFGPIIFSRERENLHTGFGRLLALDLNGLYFGSNRAGIERSFTDCLTAQGPLEPNCAP